MSKKSSLKVYGSGGATSHAGAAGYSGYKATEDEWRRPNVAQVYSAEVEEEVKPEGNPLDPYYQKQRDLLEKQKTDDLAALDRRRVQQRQEAAINNELLMKYLPQLNKANGLAGLGVSETANIDALSRYQTNLGKIEESHQQGVSDVERAYRSDLAKIDAAERTELLAEEDRLRTEAKEKEDRIRENALMYIETNLFETEEELNAFVDGLAVSDETKAEIKSLGMAQVKKIEDQTEAEKEKLGADTDTAGNAIVAAYSKGDPNNKFDFVGDANARVNLDTAGATFFVSVGDKDIPVSSGGLVPSETIPETVRSYAENDKVFTYDGGIYIKKNNSIYQVAPAGDGNDPEYNRAYNELKSYLNGGTAPTVDASPEHHEFTIGDPNSVTKYPDNISYGSEITYVDKNGKEAKGKVYFPGLVDPAGFKKQKGIRTGEVYYDEYTDTVYTFLDGALWKIKS